MDVMDTECVLAAPAAMAQPADCERWLATTVTHTVTDTVTQRHTQRVRQQLQPGSNKLATYEWPMLASHTAWQAENHTVMQLNQTEVLLCIRVHSC
jgi:hypothetical protein